MRNTSLVIVALVLCCWHMVGTCIALAEEAARQDTAPRYDIVRCLTRSYGPANPPPPPAPSPPTPHTNTSAWLYIVKRWLTGNGTSSAIKTTQEGGRACNSRLFLLHSRNPNQVVYGATSCGVSAAIAAASTLRRNQLGPTPTTLSRATDVAAPLRVALLANNTHIGGMTTGGLSETDIAGSAHWILGGFARQFYTDTGGLLCVRVL